MKQNQPGSEPFPTDETDTTMTDAGEKNAGEDPDFDEQVQQQDDREPEVSPDDPDIQGIDGSGKPS
ncbi:hypothetical protein [Stutzerimonas nitrititolerans]|uniref:hypothetical protein n=1 Tax=Stutzerimonas nitrititolerans TaxID=2482751 RepID=UPI00289E2800|nr:hypothetical protein [Stutzerimonas nitrititolerans]